LIAWQEKKRKLGVPDDEVNWQIRNNANGFVYVREDVNPDQRAIDLAIAAVKVLGLDMGAVDLIFNEKQDKWFLLEVNTAPGLEGTTPHDYATAIRKEFPG
jgi:D-alanine-D-alanine ligase-like ATP-grasp enzyme